MYCESREVTLTGLCQPKSATTPKTRNFPLGLKLTRSKILMNSLWSSCWHTACFSTSSPKTLSGIQLKLILLKHDRPPSCTATLETAYFYLLCFFLSCRWQLSWLTSERSDLTNGKYLHPPPPKKKIWWQWTPDDSLSKQSLGKVSVSYYMWPFLCDFEWLL